MKKVSIIMGMYNSEKTIRECLDSIVTQTYPNWELVICDDGSSDQSMAIVNEYKQKFQKKFVVLQNPVNMGLAGTLNRCIKFSTGEYIARMDTDDICLNDRLNKQVEFLDKHPNYQLVGSRIIVFNDKGVLGIRGGFGDVEISKLKHGSPFAHPSVMIRREALVTLNGYSSSFDTLRCEDLELWFRFYKKGYKAYNMNVPLIKYRENLGDYKKRKLIHSIGTAKTLLRGYKENSFSKASYIYALKPIMSALIPNVIMYYYHNSKLEKI